MKSQQKIDNLKFDLDNCLSTLENAPFWCIREIATKNGDLVIDLDFNGEAMEELAKADYEYLKKFTEKLIDLFWKNWFEYFTADEVFFKCDSFLLAHLDFCKANNCYSIACIAGEVYEF